MYDVQQPKKQTGPQTTSKITQNFGKANARAKTIMDFHETL
jgi:hypothetical protein